MPDSGPGTWEDDPMSRLFGTDGVRGVANRDLTPDLVLALGRAAGRVLTSSDERRVVVGRDTRISGPMLEAALVAGLCSAGANVATIGIAPTPAVAYLTKAGHAAAGAVISASHNPVEDNGIKFFTADGVKLGEDVEKEIERVLEDPSASLASGSAIGTIESWDGASDLYVDHLLHSVPQPLGGLRVVLDCAYGAAWRIGPRAFREAGAEVASLHAEADGSRINVDCGSTNMAELARAVREEGADVGFAFDGDADRVLAVDELGAEVDGDRLLGMMALRWKQEGRLPGNSVVATVMANLGFKRALEQRGVDVISAPVGDKHVAAAMAEHGSVLGGEQSGHLIFGTHATTGDGILTALQAAELLVTSNEPMSELAHFYEPFPQVLLNVRVADKSGLESAEPIWEAVEVAEKGLGAEGRVLVRASGTEPVVRVMVEAADASVARSTADSLAETVRGALG